MWYPRLRHDALGPRLYDARTTTADVITTMDATRAADATAEGIAVGTVPVMLTPWTKAGIGPDPAHGTGTIDRHHALIHDPGGMTGAMTSTSLTKRLRMPPMSVKGTT